MSSAHLREAARSYRWVVTGGLAWILALAAGFWILIRFTYKGAWPQESPAQWPRDSRIPFTSGAPQLLLFAHPHCPCSRATFADLDRLVASMPVQPMIRVFFVRPRGCPPGWERSENWDLAAHIPGAIVTCDVDGAEAARFGARLSGAVLLFDADGALRFSGGINGERGHEGCSAGSQAILAILAGRQTDTSQAPVFGCPLFDSGQSASRSTAEPLP